MRHMDPVINLEFATVNLVGRVLFAISVFLIQAVFMGHAKRRGPVIAIAIGVEFYVIKI